MSLAPDILAEIQRRIAQCERQKYELEGELSALRIKYDLEVRRHVTLLTGAVFPSGVRRHLGPSDQILEQLRVHGGAETADLAKTVYGSDGPKERHRTKVLLFNLKKKGLVERAARGWRVAG